MKETKVEDSPTDASKTFAKQKRAVYQKRWQKVREASIELEAEAIWGQVAKDNVKPLLECAGTLFAMLIVYFEHMKHPQISYSNKVGDRDHQIIFAALGEKGNFFTNEINEAVGKIEKLLKPRPKM